MHKAPVAAPAKEPPRALPPYVSEGDGCHSCPSWGRIGQAIGRCTCPNEKLLAIGSDARNGWMTSFAYICPAHPKFEA